MPLLLVFPLIVIFQLLFSLLFTHNLSYTLNSMDSVFNYRYLMNVPWAPDRDNILFIFPVALVILGVYLKKTKIVSVEIRNVLLILISSSFVGVISALSRSDAEEILLGVYPSLLLSLQLYSLSQRRTED